MTKCDVLKMSRNIVEKLDHCKGHYITGKDGVILSSQATMENATGCCMLGATMLATPIDWSKPTDAERDVVEKARMDAQMALLDVVPGRNIPKFNDDPTTTKADVLAMFDLCIFKADCPKETIQ